MILCKVRVRYTRTIISHCQYVKQDQLGVPQRRKAHLELDAFRDLFISDLLKMIKGSTASVKRAFQYFSPKKDHFAPNLKVGSPWSTLVAALSEGGISAAPNDLFTFGEACITTGCCVHNNHSLTVCSVTHHQVPLGELISPKSCRNTRSLGTLVACDVWSGLLVPGMVHRAKPKDLRSFCIP